MGALSGRAAACGCHSPSGCMQWDSKYMTIHTPSSTLRLFPSISRISNPLPNTVVESSVPTADVRTWDCARLRNYL